MLSHYLHQVAQEVLTLNAPVVTAYNEKTRATLLQIAVITATKQINCVLVITGNNLTCLCGSKYVLKTRQHSKQLFKLSPVF